MTSERLLIKTSKGVQSLLEGSIGLDDKHVKVLGLLDGTRQMADLAKTTSYTESEVQLILQKLTLIGYARSIGSSVPNVSLDSNAEKSALRIWSGSNTFGSSKTFEGGEKWDGARSQGIVSGLDIAALRSAAKSREHSMTNAINLGSAEDVWKNTHELAQQMLSERLEHEQASRRAAEIALEESRLREVQAREREASLEKARQAEEEALVKSKEEVRARAQAVSEAESIRQQAYELEQARARRLGVYRRRMRVSVVSALFVVIGVWGWHITSEVFIDKVSCSRLLSNWAQMESSVAACKTSFLPSPHYEVKSVSIDKIKADSVEGSLALLPLLVGHIEPTSLSIHGLSLDINEVEALLRRPHKGRLGSVHEVEIDRAKMLIGNVSLDSLKGSASLDTQGQLNHLSLIDDEHLARFSITHEKGAVKFSAQSRFVDSMSAPISGAVDFSAYGTLERDRLVIEDGSIGFKNGQAAFSGVLAWGTNSWSGQGKIESHSVGLSDIAPWLFNNGTADLSGKISFNAETPTRAIQEAIVELSGPGRNLSLRIDLPEMLGASGPLGFSVFPQAVIQMRLAQRSQNFNMPTLMSGPFRANVEASLSVTGKVTGVANASMPERGLSASMFLSGTPKRIEMTQKNTSKQ